MDKFDYNDKFYLIYSGYDAWPNTLFK